MRTLSILLLALLCMAGVSACKKSKDASASQTDWTNKIKSLYTYNQSKITITEGITGTVTKRTGNCMPPLDSNNTTCKEVPVQRNVYIYEYTTLNNIKGDIKEFQPPATQLKALIKADAEGFYQFTIGPGIYSIFVEENGAFYANTIDAQGGINPVEVIAGKISTSNPVIDYASY